MIMYGLRLRHTSKQVAELSLLQAKLPEEILTQILSKLPSLSLGLAQCVCKQFRSLCCTDTLWRPASVEAFWQEFSREAAPVASIHALVRSQYRGSWHKMFMERPHLRFDGLYVSRNTYIRTGLVEWRVKNPVHLVCYYRYFRFFPDGTLLYRTSPEVPVQVQRSMRTLVRNRMDEGVLRGRYLLRKDNLFTSLPLGNTAGTEIRTRLRLRSTCRGGNNRLDVDKILSYDRGSDLGVPMLDHANGEEEEEVGGRQYRRGLAPYTFVAWEHMQDSILNLPVHKMDFYVAG
ncbi:hypothetical protein WJX75_001739 [Coccomyxa subellipsoidea]|uniref:F-box domain-containing protein n=1 Tax=Coccomyxa subellipsoidea TaxID=248742 RepID=A0ABR2YIX2_9CHLO